MLKPFERSAVFAAGAMLLAGGATAQTAAPKAAAAPIPNPAAEWNHVWTEVLWDLWIIGIVFAIVAVYLLVKYRAKSPDAVGTAAPPIRCRSSATRKASLTASASLPSCRGGRISR